MIAGRVFILPLTICSWTGIAAVQRSRDDKAVVGAWHIKERGVTKLFIK